MTEREPVAPQCRHEAGCITCSEEGIPMRVVEAHADDDIATCEDAEGSRSDVLIGLVAPVAIGDLLLVHAGTALLRLHTHAGDAA